MSWHQGNRATRQQGRMKITDFLKCNALFFLFDVRFHVLLPPGLLLQIFCHGGAGG